MSNKPKHQKTSWYFRKVMKERGIRRVSSSLMRKVKGCPLCYLAELYEADESWLDDKNYLGFWKVHHTDRNGVLK